MVDALVLYGDEGRSKRTIWFGEPANGFDPSISEWGNPAQVILCNFERRADVLNWNLLVNTGKENKRIILKIAASEIREAQTYCSNTMGVVGYKRSYLEQ